MLLVPANWPQITWLSTHVLHELAADGADLLAECGAEHHALLLVGRQPEDILHVTPHVCRGAPGKERKKERKRERDQQ